MMRLPFSVEEFLNVFETYNQAIWPMQLVLYGLALVALFFVVRPRSYSSRLISLILALLWLWTGIVYQIGYFSAINPAAYLFGALFIVQGLLFLYTGVFRSKLLFTFQPDASGLLGGILILYGLVIYPILGYLLGHAYPASPTFGAPCPTTIFTFGLLLWTEKTMPKYLLAIPFLWSLLGFSAALSLTIREDLGLLVAGLLGTAWIFLRGTNLVSHDSSITLSRR